MTSPDATITTWTKGRIQPNGDEFAKMRTEKHSNGHNTTYIRWAITDGVHSADTLVSTSPDGTVTTSTQWQYLTDGSQTCKHRTQKFQSGWIFEHRHYKQKADLAMSSRYHATIDPHGTKTEYKLWKQSPDGTVTATPISG